MDDFLQNAEPRVIALMMVVIVFLISMIQVMYLLLPQFKQHQKLADNYQVLNQAAGSSLGLENQLQIATEEVNNLSYQLHGDMQGLPEKQLESYIIGRLQKISWETSVELASVIPGNGKRVQMFQETLFDVKINATYFNFFKWLQTINNELGYIVVKKFEIHPKTGKVENDPELSITLTLVTYRMVRNG